MRPTSVRIFISISLCAHFTWAQSSGGRSSRADLYAQKMDAPVRSFSASTGATGADLAATSTQALILMTTLASVEGMKQKLEIAGVKKENVSIPELIKVSQDSSSELLQSSELASGLIGMKVANTAGKGTLDALNGLLQNSATKGMLKELVSSGSANMVGFVGFEAGAELMNRAIQMLPDAADREKATKLIPLMWKAFVKQDFSANAEEKRITAAVFGNMYEILVNNSELREKWWSFTVRNRIQTGNFVAGVSMFTAGSMLGNKIGNCMPTPPTKIAAWAIGTGGGILGGLGAAFIPKEKKDEITSVFQSARMRASSTKIGVSQDNLRSLTERLEFATEPWRVTNIEKQAEDELAKIHNSREDLMTSFYDRVHLLNSRMYEIQNRITMAQEHQNTEVEASLKKELADYQAAFDRNTKEVDARLKQEESYFERISKRSKNPQIEEKIKADAEELRSVRKQTGEFLKQVRGTALWGKSGAQTAQGLMGEQESQRLLEKFYLWGFKQKPFVETMEYNN